MDERKAMLALTTGIKLDRANILVSSFKKRFHEPHYYFACHAAFPLALTPDLLYRLWANFQYDSQGKWIHIPWIAVSDLLLSNLCKEVGHELYEMDIAVRNELLANLEEMPQFANQRLTELAQFLQTYIQPMLKSNDPDVRDFAQAQRWAVLFVTHVDMAAHELVVSLYDSLSRNNKPEQARILSLIETFATPLDSTIPLLMDYARGIRALLFGDREHAAAQLSKVAYEGSSSVKIQGIAFPMPKQIIQGGTHRQATENSPSEAFSYENPYLQSFVSHDTLLSHYMVSEKNAISLDALQQAAVVYRTSLTLSTREHTPDNWALLQNNLGITLYGIALLAQGEKRIAALKKALDCFNASITFYKQKPLGMDWAIVQCNIGKTLYSLSEMLYGSNRYNTLQKSVQCYLATLTLYTSTNFPLEWAKTMYCLGLAYGAFEMEEEDHLKQAIISMQTALHVFTFDAFPVDYAMAQANLGNAYFRRSKENNKDREYALNAYKSALMVFNQSTFPMQWAAIQANQGKINQLCAVEVQSGDPDTYLNLTREAIKHYRSALRIYDKEAFNQQKLKINDNIRIIHNSAQGMFDIDDLVYMDIEYYFDKFIEKYERYVISRVNTLKIDLINDIVQEVFFDMYVKLRDERRIKVDSIRNILYQLVDMKGKDYLRRANREISLEMLLYGSTVDVDSLSSSVILDEEEDETINFEEDEETIYFDQEKEGILFGIASEPDELPEALAELEDFCTLLADQITRLTPALSRAMLIDLANFDFEPSSFLILQKAFFHRGVQLTDYKQLFPQDAQGRSRHNASLRLARKQLRTLREGFMMS